MASRDYEEFIAALNAHGVRYLVVGAHAVAFHARPRATKDLDVFVEPTHACASRQLARSAQRLTSATVGLPGTSRMEGNGTNAASHTKSPGARLPTRRAG